MSSDLSVAISRVINPPWTEVPVVAVGSVPSGRGTPNLYAVVSEHSKPAFRLDVYGAQHSESHFRSEALTWCGNVVLGFGWHVYVVNARTLGCVMLDLPCYFDSFRASSDYLLVVFGTGILRLDSRGSILWENASLAVDGVEIQTIEADSIAGVGEWDPPGDWRSFAISLVSGR